MSRSTSPNQGQDPKDMDRMLDLLADQALEGLTAAEAAELARLLEANPGFDAEAFDKAASAATLAMMTADEPMPAHLRTAIAASGKRLVEANRATLGSASQSWWAKSGWFAAAACLALAVTAWWPRDAEIPPAEVRAALIAEAPADLIQWPWTATEDPAANGATGDVVWSNSKQQGFMRFAGLAPNDPTREQYQLWIFDKDRPAETPVDGGVFDVDPATGEVVIAIDPKVRVTDATMFAVTVEKPGGVVVSKRERIPVLAKPAA